MTLLVAEEHAERSSASCAACAARRLLDAQADVAVQGGEQSSSPRVIRPPTMTSSMWPSTHASGRSLGSIPATSGSCVTRRIVFPARSAARRTSPRISSAVWDCPGCRWLHPRESDRGIVDQGARDGDALLLTAGELAGAGGRRRSPRGPCARRACSARSPHRRRADGRGSSGRAPVMFSTTSSCGDQVVRLEDEADLAPAQVRSGRHRSDRPRDVARARDSRHPTSVDRCNPGC